MPLPNPVSLLSGAAAKLVAGPEARIHREGSVELARSIDIADWLPWAIANIESANMALTARGNPVLRFEAHWWKKLSAATPDARPFDTQRNLNDLDKRHEMFLRMRAVDRRAAILSHSWGAFQIMGFNLKLCGHESPEAFEHTMLSVPGQMQLFRTFCLSNVPLLSAMRRGDLHDIAYHYNGPNYAKNRYVEKLIRERDKFRETKSWA